jgi:hypothetical protein
LRRRYQYPSHPLEPRRLDEARRSLDHLSRQWDEALDRLRMLVEE